MSLENKLRAIRDQAKEKFPPEIIDTMHKATTELQHSGILDQALKIGDTLPPFELPNIDKKSINSQDVLQKGPLVLTFYRGAW